MAPATAFRFDAMNSRRSVFTMHGDAAAGAGGAASLGAIGAAAAAAAAPVPVVGFGWLVSAAVVCGTVAAGAVLAAPPDVSGRPFLGEVIGRLASSVP